MRKTTLIFWLFITFTAYFITVIACRKENAASVVVKEKLTGIVQKGPYADATISLYELDEKLEQTGICFNAQTHDKKASFEIGRFALSTQYAELKANGYYFNEVTGDVSPYHLSLKAISDIKDLSAVNINLMTHLEDERVKYLVKNGSNFSDAKDSAQKEILAIFGFSFLNMDKSEKLDISVDNDENAILLAISVILQGNRSVKNLTDFLTNLSSDLREDGKLDNDSIVKNLRATILKLDLGKIRNNIETRYKELGSSSSIPDFEKYINTFLAYTGLVPSVITLPAASVTTTEAQLNGTVNANDLRTEVIFEYGPTTSYGKIVASEPGILKGHATVPVAILLKELNPGSLYHFRARAVNSLGTVYGNDLSFTTLGKVPTAIALPASGISSTVATLNGTVNPNYFSTTVAFEYGTSETYGSIVTAAPGQITGSAASNVAAMLSQLNPGTLYHFRIKAENLFGTIYSSDLTFTTLGSIPSAVTLAANGITASAAILNANVNANYVNTAVTFEYGLTVAYESTVSGNSGQEVSGHLVTTVTGNISGLIPGTVYHFRVKAVNSLGTAYGNDLTFRTLGSIPSAYTNPATTISADVATLNGYVTANYMTTTISFEYGITLPYESEVSATPSQITGNSASYVTRVISGLIRNTVYHFRVKSINSFGTGYGGDLTFKTLGDVPIVIMNNANNITGTAATLNGTVTANGFSTVVTFEYGETTGYGNTRTATQSPLNGSYNGSVSASISGLIPGKLYHFRIKAVNSIGTTYGSDKTFTSLTGLIYNGNGIKYNPVATVGQGWMAESIRTSPDLINN